MSKLDDIPQYVFRQISILKTTEVELDNIVENPAVRLKSRTHGGLHAKAQSAALTDSSKNLAIHSAPLLITCPLVDLGQYALVDGKRLVAAARKCKAQTILAKVLVGDTIMASGPFADIPVDQRWHKLRQSLLLYHFSTHFYTTPHTEDELRDLFSTLDSTELKSTQAFSRVVLKHLGISSSNPHYRDIKRTWELMNEPEAYEIVTEGLAPIGLMKVEANRDVFKDPKGAEMAKRRLHEYGETLRAALPAEERDKRVCALKGYNRKIVEGILDEVRDTTLSEAVTDIAQSRVFNLKISYADTVVRVPAFHLDFADDSRNGISKMLECAFQLRHLTTLIDDHVGAIKPRGPGQRARKHVSKPHSPAYEDAYVNDVSDGHWERYCHVRKVDLHLARTKGIRLIGDEERKGITPDQLHLRLVQALTEHNLSELEKSQRLARKAENDADNRRLVRKRASQTHLAEVAGELTVSEQPDCIKDGDGCTSDQPVRPESTYESEEPSSIGLM